MAIWFDRPGRLVCHGQTDRFNRPDAVEFHGRSGQQAADRMAEAWVWIDRWPTRAGVAVLLELAATEWVPCADALPFDGLYLQREEQVQIVFGVYVRLQPGHTYRLHLPGAVITRHTVRIGAATGQLPEPQTANRRAS